MQQLELAQIQQRDANLTALAAIGPRKKRPLESGSGNEVVIQRLLFYFSCQDSMPKGSKDMQILQFTLPRTLLLPNAYENSPLSIS